MKFDAKVFGYFLLVLAIGCGPAGPTYEERQRLQDEERQERISQANAKLDAFAQDYDAVPMDFGGYTSSLGSDFTAISQRELEGKVVAFKGALLDVQRNSSGVYEAVFGERYLSSTTIHLSISLDEASDILSRPKEQYENEMMVAARIERIARHQLGARVCGEPDCNTVSIDVNSFSPSYQIWGQMLGLRLEEPGT